MKKPRTPHAAHAAALSLLLATLPPAAAGTLRTWDGPASGAWTTAANWSGDDVPNTVDEDALIDDNGAQSSAVSCSVAGGTALTNGTVTVESGDALSLNASGGSATIRFAALRNAGRVSVNAPGGANARTLTVVVTNADVAVNAPGGFLAVTNGVSVNRCHAVLTIPAQNANLGCMIVSLLHADRNSARLRLDGSGTFTNHGTITVRYLSSSTGSGGSSGGPSAARINLETAGATVTLGGTGLVDLVETYLTGRHETEIAGVSGTSPGTLINGAAHTIAGSGIIGGSSGNNSVYTYNLNLVNEGLVLANSATNENMRLYPHTYVTNAAGGRMVAASTGGLSIGATGKRFVNLGRLEARTGSRVALAGTVVLHGEVRGGGTFTNTADIVLDDGCTLAPGDSADADGTGASTAGLLSMDTACVLSAGTTLAFQLGNAGSAGIGSDTVFVNGGLTLDGTLDVTPLPGFGGGTYRLFTCVPGGITDNGLAYSGPGFIAVDDSAGTVDLVVPASGTVLLVR